MMDLGSESSDDNDSSAHEENLKELNDDELFELEFATHKRDYYINKLKYPEMTKYVKKYC